MDVPSKTGKSSSNENNVNRSNLPSLDDYKLDTITITYFQPLESSNYTFPESRH